MLVDQQLIEQLIENQRVAIRWYSRWAIGLFVMGAVILVGALIGPGPESAAAQESLKVIIGLGGGALSAISAFPLKEVRNRKDKVSVLLTLQGKIETTRKSERAKVDQLIWKVVEATALG